jgi:nucleotide-binding universal stress UspA family protein
VILKASHNLADNAGFELHAVTAYKGDELYSDRQMFANACRLPRNRVHWGEGAPQKVISEVGDDLGADVIVVGNAGRSFNETAQRLIDEVSADVFVLPPPESLRVA